LIFSQADGKQDSIVVSKGFNVKNRIPF